MENFTLPSNEEAQLVKFSSESMLKSKFSKVNLSQFWCIVWLSIPPLPPMQSNISYHSAHCIVLVVYPVNSISSDNLGLLHLAQLSPGEVETRTSHASQHCGIAVFHWILKNKYLQLKMLSVAICLNVYS